MAILTPNTSPRPPLAHAMLNTVMYHSVEDPLLHGPSSGRSTPSLRGDSSWIRHRSWLGRERSIVFASMNVGIKTRDMVDRRIRSSQDAEATCFYNPWSTLVYGWEAFPWKPGKDLFEFDKHRDRSSRMVPWSMFSQWDAPPIYSRLQPKRCSGIHSPSPSLD